MVDVTIYGAGVFGLSIAFTLLRRGAQVRVIDPNGPGAGSSGGVLGALAPHVPENWNAKKQFQLESLLMAPAFWADVAQISGADPMFRRSGRVQPLNEADRPLAEARSDGAAALWRGEADWFVKEGQFWGQSGLWIHDTLTAQVQAAAATRALAAACVALGADVLTDAEPKGAIVLAKGASGLTELSAELSKTVGVPVKGQAALLRADIGEVPQLFVDGLHVLAHLDGTVAVGSTTERDVDHLQTDEQLDALVEKAKMLVPVLRDAPVIQRWAGFRPRAKSRAPMLGGHPKREGIFIANGGFKIGFGMAPKVAEVMADLLLDGRDTIPQGFRVEDNL